MREGWRGRRMAEVLSQTCDMVATADLATVPYAGVRLSGRGVYRREPVPASDVKAARLNRIRAGQVVYNRMWATRGSFGVAGPDADGCLVTNDFPVFDVLPDVLPGYLRLLFETELFQQQAAQAAVGTTERRRLHEQDFLDLTLNLPPLAEQRRIVDLVEAVDDYCVTCDAQVAVSTQMLSRARETLVRWEGLQPLSSACSIQSSLVSPTDSDFSGLPHIGVESIERGTGRLLPTRPAAEDGVTSGKYLVDPRDVVYAKIRPELRKAVWPRTPALCSADAYPLRPAPSVLPEFLLEVLLSDRFSAVAIARSARTKMPKINREALFTIEVPLPPLEEQQRIAGAITAVRTVLDASRTALDLAKRLRAAAIADLLSGAHEIPESYDRFLAEAS